MHLRNIGSWYKRMTKRKLNSGPSIRTKVGPGTLIGEINEEQFQRT